MQTFLNDKKSWPKKSTQRLLLGSSLSAPLRCDYKKGYLGSIPSISEEVLDQAYSPAFRLWHFQFQMPVRAVVFVLKICISQFNSKG